MTASWTVSPTGLGTIRPLAGSTVNFIAGPRGGLGTVTATGGGFTASAPIVVAPGTLRVAGIRYGIGAGRTLLVTVSLVDVRGRPVPNAYVSVLVRRRGYPFATGRGTTLGTGRKTFRIRHKPGCYRTTVVRANANGYRWDGNDTGEPVLQVARVGTARRQPGGDGAATIPAPLGVFPSGQRGRAVNPLALPSEVRILPPPLLAAKSARARSARA